MAKNYQFWVVMATAWVAIYLFYSHWTAQSPAAETKSSFAREASRKPRRIESQNSSDESEDNISSGAVARAVFLQTPATPTPAHRTLDRDWVGGRDDSNGNSGNLPSNFSPNDGGTDDSRDPFQDEALNSEDNLSDQMNSELDNSQFNSNINADPGIMDTASPGVEPR